MNAMEEKCKEHCSLVLRMGSLEEQFKGLQNRKNTDHQDIFKRLRGPEKLMAVQEERDKTINDKLDKLVDWQEHQQDRPGRLQERLIEGALLAVVGGIIGVLLAHIGIM